jgi:hypothetical protein
VPHAAGGATRCTADWQRLDDGRTRRATPRSERFWLPRRPTALRSYIDCPFGFWRYLLGITVDEEPG